MTTTLRPTGPEQHDGNVISRSFDLCVNSRPIGIVRLATDPLSGPSTGRIVQLVVEERERRRGRGTAAVLAAEEVLRDWGCVRVEMSIPERTGRAQPFAPALGFLESGRHLLKDLTATEPPPGLPGDSTARPMTAEEFTSWRARDREHRLTSLIELGVPQHAALKRIEWEEQAHFPEGERSEGSVVRLLEHEGAPAGLVWLGLDRIPRSDADAWIYVLEVPEEARGRGHGHTLVNLAETEARAAGRSSLGLHVEALNTVAQRLYAASGFRCVERHYWKVLSG